MVKLCGVTCSCLAMAVLLSIESSTFELKEVYSWKKLDFLFPNETVRENQLKSGAYIQENNLPLGLEVWKNKLFVTVPRRKPGVAATLTYIDLNVASGNKSPELIPYPDWDTHQLDEKNGSKIISVYRLNVDVCDRLWLIDAGNAVLADEYHSLLPPRILVFDLKTDKLILEYYFKKDDLKEDSILVNIIVDVTVETCDKAFAYIADTTGYGLIVYDLQKNDSWRISNNFFHIDPLDGNYVLRGVNIRSDDGIFGLALSALNEDGYRKLYFHPLVSDREFAVSTQVLQNKTESENYSEYKMLGSRGPKTHSTGSSLDETTGVLLYTQVQKDGIGCWNSVKHAHEYSSDTNVLIASNNETLIFPSDVKVDKNGNFWVISDRLPLFWYVGLDFSDTNFRIFTAPVAEAIKGTICDAGRWIEPF